MNVLVNGEKWDIAHIPINYEIFLQSLIEKTGNIDNTEEDDSTEFDEAYLMWKTENGGIWSIPLSQAINISSPKLENNLFSPACV